MTTGNSDDNIIQFPGTSDEDPQVFSVEETEKKGLANLRMRIERIVAIMVNFSDIIEGVEMDSIDYTKEDLVVVDLVLQKLEESLMTGTIYGPDE